MEINNEKKHIVDKCFKELIEFGISVGCSPNEVFSHYI